MRSKEVSEEVDQDSDIIRDILDLEAKDDPQMNKRLFQKHILSEQEL